MNDDIPLCVDLDGTLVRSDLLVESFFQLLRVNILCLARVPIWLARGKASLKDQIAQRVELHVDRLPYDDALVSYLKAAAAAGRTLVLVTATHEKYARAVADHLGIFDEVIATRPGRNVAGKVKRDLLLERYGEQGFDYAGNSRADIGVWKHARHAILVNPEPGVEAAAHGQVTFEKVFSSQQAGAGEYLRAMRPHQWLKNTLVFIPLLVSHSWHDLTLVLLAVVAFFSFCLAASGVYLLNDLMDLPYDRQHTRKRNRPFAAGRASVKAGAVLGVVLLLVAIGLSMVVTPLFALALCAYVVTSMGYSLYLKQIVLIDVLVLAGLYTIRIIGGALAISVNPSFWLLAFSMFLFLSLAMVKRFTELISLENRQASTGGRDYRPEDLETINTLGAVSGYLAVLVLALYINSQEVRVLYERPEVIWLLCPLLLYWISRVWLMARRGNMHDDPVVFAMEDGVSRWIAVIGLVIVMVAV